MKSRASLYLLTLVTLFAAGGSSCPWRRRELVDPAPVVFQQPPSLADMIQAVNANTAPIRQLQAESATLTIHGVSLRTNLAVERPQRLRLHAELTAFSGAELDLGSNDELFWMWVKRSPRPAVYYARHDQYLHSPARQLLPIEPRWLIDALGLLTLDPQGLHDGPHRRSPGTLELRTRYYTPQGEQVRITILDDTRGWILEQHIYDERNQLIASVRSSQHRYYAEDKVSLPHHLDVQVPTAGLAFELDVAKYSINRLLGEAAQLWSLPQLGDYPLVNLASPEAQAALQPFSPPATPPNYPQTGFRPRFRGYTNRQ